MFSIGTRTAQNLSTVHPLLSTCITLALCRFSSVDFSVTEGKRTEKRQFQLVKQKKSKTLHSKHLPDIKDGLGRAVDVAGYVDRKTTYDVDTMCKIAAGVAVAAKYCNITIRWGGFWDKNLTDIQPTWIDIKEEMLAYQERQKAKGREPFIDLPHFELVG